MTYEYLSWQTINIPVPTSLSQYSNVYFVILHRPVTSGHTPNTEYNYMIYSGIISKISGKLQNIDDILSQYVKPAYVPLEDGLYTDPQMYFTFYIYYSGSPSWSSWEYDTVIMTYDWSYDTTPKAQLSDPINNLLDYRQLLVFSIKPSTPDVSQTITVNLEGTQIDQFTITGYTTYNYFKDLTQLTYPAEFNYDYSYDFFIDSSTPVGEYATLYINNRPYYIAATCNRYCLYYLNQNGGWDSLLVKGTSLQTDDISRMSYRQNFIAGTGASLMRFNKIDYLTTIQEAWQLNTSYLDDTQSSKMINLLASNRIYLHDFIENTIKPVNIVNSNCEHKTIKNQGRRFATYTIEVEYSQPKYRI